MLHLLALLIPGLPQFQRGQRLVGLVLGLAAMGTVLHVYWYNRELLLLHRELRERVPRSTIRELVADKEAQKLRGLAAAVALVLLSGFDAAFGPRGRGTRADPPTERKDRSP
jgi:hypothetical protein